MRSVPGGTKRIGVMGGTFDPIHLGHLIAASEVRHHFQLDRVMFVPTGQPWQKDSFSDSEDRYQMTVLGAATNPFFAVSRMEIDRLGPTFTVDTLRALRDFHGPQTSLFFILGADAALKLGTWHHVEGLEDLAEVIAVARPGFDLGLLDLKPGWPRVNVLSMLQIDISSSDIRERVQAGRPIHYLVPQSVERYIRERGLYLKASRGPGTQVGEGAGA
jgi:nicotinate-nucleotide adenylyltransferase